MNKRLLSLLFLVLLTASSCSVYSVDSKDLTNEFYPPKNSTADIVFLENIDKPHTVIAQITVTTERRQRMQDVIHRMKREAAILGGDAITDIRSDATGEWKKLPAQTVIGNGYIRANFTANVVVFK